MCPADTFEDTSSRSEIGPYWFGPWRNHKTCVLESKERDRHIRGRESRFRSRISMCCKSSISVKGKRRQYSSDQFPAPWQFFLHYLRDLIMPSDKHMSWQESTTSRKASSTRLYIALGVSWLAASSDVP